MSRVGCIRGDINTGIVGVINLASELPQSALDVGLFMEGLFDRMLPDCL